jgi:2-keto-4-pentenoate hydratase/2-oxohepta-3-ene-1,7-dioic acid hydratase in catechol pathway
LLTPFALGTFADGDRSFPGLVLRERHVLDISSEFRSTRDVLTGWEANLERLEELAVRGADGAVDVDSLRVLPPVRPSQILQSGANYHKHVVELAVDQQIGRRADQTDEEFCAEVTRMMDERAASGEPYIFLGADCALVGAFDDVVLPKRGEQHDWELELTVVIGRTGRDVPVEEALGYVAGYTIANDLTTRDLVIRKDLGPIGSDWVRSKNAPTFLPVGPWIVPTQFVENAMDLRIMLKLNGETMQDESTADMIFDVARLVSYASSLVELRSGDLLLTGSPAGNGTHYNRFLRAGDVIEAEITGLGRQQNRVVDESRS